MLDNVLRQIAYRLNNKQIVAALNFSARLGYAARAPRFSEDRRDGSHAGGVVGRQEGVA